MPIDDLPLKKIDHVKFFVGNARQSAYFYRNAFGFDVVAYAGLETRVKHEAGYVLKQGHIQFVLVSPLSAASDASAAAVAISLEMFCQPAATAATVGEHAWSTMTTVMNSTSMRFAVLIDSVPLILKLCCQSY